MQVANERETQVPIGVVMHDSSSYHRRVKYTVVREQNNGIERDTLR